MNRAAAILFFVGPCVGLIGGLITWGRPKRYFCPVGWAVALIGAPILTFCISENGGGYIWIWSALYAPIACLSAAVVCGIVSGAGLVKERIWR